LWNDFWLELNDILNFSGYTQVDEDDDSDEINVEDCDRDEEASTKEEEDNSDDHESSGADQEHALEAQVSNHDVRLLCAMS
jgi:hypothetical protein